MAINVDWKDIEIRILGHVLAVSPEELGRIAKTPGVLQAEIADYCELAATQSARAELAGRTLARWVSEAIYG